MSSRGDDRLLLRTDPTWIGTSGRSEFGTLPANTSRQIRCSRSSLKGFPAPSIDRPHSAHRFVAQEAAIREMELRLRVLLAKPRNQRSVAGHILAVRARAAESAPRSRRIRTLKHTMDQTIHLADECRMKNFVARIAMNPECDSAIEPEQLPELAIRRFVQRCLSTQRRDHSLRRAIGSLRPVQHLTTVQRDLAIVVRDHHNIPIIAFSQPTNQLVAMMFIERKCVVCIEQTILSIQAGIEIPTFDCPENERTAPTMPDRQTRSALRRTFRVSMHSIIHPLATAFAFEIQASSILVLR